MWTFVYKDVNHSVKIGECKWVSIYRLKNSRVYVNNAHPWLVLFFFFFSSFFHFKISVKFTIRIQMIELFFCLIIANTYRSQLFPKNSIWLSDRWYMQSPLVAFPPYVWNGMKRGREVMRIWMVIFVRKREQRNRY